MAIPTFTYKDTFSIQLEMHVPLDAGQEIQNNFAQTISTFRDLKFCQQVIAETVWKFADQGLAMNERYSIQIENFEFKSRIVTASSCEKDLNNKRQKIIKSANIEWEVNAPGNQTLSIPFDRAVQNIEQSNLSAPQKIMLSVLHSFHHDDLVTPFTVENVNHIYKDNIVKFSPVSIPNSEVPYRWLFITIGSRQKELRNGVPEQPDSTTSKVIGLVLGGPLIALSSPLWGTAWAVVKVTTGESIFAHGEQPSKLIFPKETQFTEDCQRIINQLRIHGQVRKLAENLTEELRQQREVIKEATKAFENGKEEIKQQNEQLEKINDKQEEVLDVLRKVNPNTASLNEYRKLVDKLIVKIEETKGTNKKLNNQNERLKQLFQKILKKESSFDEYKKCFEEALKIIEG